jgi:serine protease Do
MTLRVPLYLTLVLLFSSVALAQQPAAPPPPAAPPAAPHAPAPATPESPEVFSFSFNSGDSFLGIYPEEVSTGNMKQYGLSEPRGVAVARVIAGSPAERAGIKKDDVILQFNGEEVTGIRKLNRLINEVAPDHTARLRLSRGGSEQEVSVTVAKRESFPRAFGMNIPKEELDRLGNELGRLGKVPGFENVPGRDDFSFVFGANRRIGIGASQLTKQLADYFGVSGGRGVLVTSVTEGGPAAKAGLKAGDVITAVDGNAIERIADLMRELNRKGEGEVTIQVIRDKSSRTFKLTPERGSSFEFGPEINIAPQVGQLALPRIAIPAIHIPAMQKIVLPAMPKMNKIVLPRMPVIRIPRVLPMPL